MTRKDYELIASGLRSTMPAKTNPYPDAYHGWHSAVTGLAARLASANPLFDRQRFLSACGVAS